MHRGLLALALGAVLLAGCDTSQYAFTIDDSVTIVVPERRQTVSLPATIRWDDVTPPEDGRVAPGDTTAEYYGVFVDRTPLRPGQALSALVPDDEGCAERPGCPDPTTLRDRGVLLTARPQVTLDFLADLRPSGRPNAGDPHEVIVVRMRGDERVGEAAFAVDFFVRRGAP